MKEVRFFILNEFYKNTIVEGSKYKINFYNVYDSQEKDIKIWEVSFFKKYIQNSLITSHKDLPFLMVLRNKHTASSYNFDLPEEWLNFSDFYSDIIHDYYVSNLILEKTRYKKLFIRKFHKTKKISPTNIMFSFKTTEMLPALNYE